MFGKLQTTIHATALMLVVSSASAGVPDSDLKLTKATSDDLVCHTFAIELQSAKQQGGLSFFANIDRHCVQRILAYQPGVLNEKEVTTTAHYSRR